MCLACEEEAFYQAYLAHLEKKAKEEAAAAARNPAEPVLCEDAAGRADRDLNRKQ